MRKLFGTDGIRGVAGEYPLDAATVTAIGAALANTLLDSGHEPHVLLGMDTRESGPAIAAQLAAGLRSEGAACTFVGVLTTPGVAYLAHTHGFAAGVVISASHNPWQDNGIKIFGSNGYKLADSAELAIEQGIFGRIASAASTAVTPEVDTLAQDATLVPDYAAWLLSEVPGLSLSGLRIAVDCANGAAFALAPEILRRLGADVVATHAAPDGRNINAGCGALHAEVMAAEVAAQEADIGITFDGDADRVMFATSAGKVVNGDGVLLLASEALRAQGRLHNDTVVGTTMSNMGLETLLKQRGITMHRAPVGDKYVLEQMHNSGAVLGGEQSGHILFADRATTGDGLLTALVVLDVVARSGQSLAELVRDLKTYPQTIVNVRVREKLPLEQIAGYSHALHAAMEELGDRGRIVVRYSGTEKLARVMVEAEDPVAMETIAGSLAAILRASIGE